LHRQSIVLNTRNNVSDVSVLNCHSIAEALCVFGNVFFDPFECSGSQWSQKINGAEAAFAFDGKISLSVLETSYFPFGRII